MELSVGVSQEGEPLLSQVPDVAIIPECTEKSALALEQSGYQTLWFGSNPRKKGVGVFCREGWSITALPQPRHKWIAPVQIDGPTPFRLLAVWACVSEVEGVSGYIGQVHNALLSHPDWFDGTPVVLAGDLNSNKQWDKPRRVDNHSDVVQILSERGLVSGYHQFFGEDQGLESRPTIHLHRHIDRPYHIDYIFIPRAWTPYLKSVDVGTYQQWSKLSDHCPVILDLEDMPRSSVPLTQAADPALPVHR